MADTFLNNYAGNSDAIICPECKSLFDESQVNVKYGLVQCVHCQKKFKPKLKVSQLPANYKFVNEGSELLIKRRWFEKISDLFFPGLFAFAFGISTAFILFAVLKEGIKESAVFLFLLVPFAFVAYISSRALLETVLNTTEIRVTKDSLSVAVYPLAAENRQKSISVSMIEQIFCKEIVRGYKSVSGCKLLALLTDGSEIEIEVLDNLSEARALEILLEKHLEIEDNFVAGESFNSVVVN